MNNTEVTNRIEVKAGELQTKLFNYRMFIAWDDKAKATNALKEAMSILDEIIELSQGLPSNDTEVTSEAF